MSWLLDTCVISELVKPSPAASVCDWLAARDEETLFLSAITLGELEKGVAKLPASARKKTQLARWLRSELPERFSNRILPVDAQVAARWGELAGGAAARGKPLPVIDGLIAATALQHNLTVVTRNVRDFERCGVRPFNPWAD